MTTKNPTEYVEKFIFLLFSSLVCIVLLTPYLNFLNTNEKQSKFENYVKETIEN